MVPVACRNPIYLKETHELPLSSPTLPDWYPRGIDLVAYMVYSMSGIRSPIPRIMRAAYNQILGPISRTEGLFPSVDRVRSS